MSKMMLRNVRLSYANIWEPKSVNGSDPKYSVSLLIDKKDKKQIAEIKKQIEIAKEEGKGKFAGKIPAVLKTPLRDGDEERPDDENYEGVYFMNANSTQAPGIVDKNVNPIIDQSEVYSGCFANVTVNFYCFNTNGNKGVACGLGNIQKVNDGDNLGGRTRAEDDFSAVDSDDEVDL